MTDYLSNDERGIIGLWVMDNISCAFIAAHANDITIIVLIVNPRDRDHVGKPSQKSIVRS